MRFQCPLCRKVVAAAKSQMGQQLQCGNCNEIVTAPASRFSTGSVIADFVIMKEIGRGGMGVVYLVHQLSLDRPAALKILLDSYCQNPEFVANFIKEARLAAKLNHPHIVQAYAVGEDEGIFYFAMEYIDGETLKDILRREKVIQIDQAVILIQQVAEALDCAWKEQKLVHRDIKPDNIMLTNKNQAKLADLGLSRIAGEFDADDDGDEVMGTPQYISPEQLTGAPVDIRSDIYSLGATFYQFVTGRFPYEGRNGAEIARKHLEEELTPPSYVNNRIPESINQIICKMMKKNVNERYQDAESLVEDLRMFRRGKMPGIGLAAPKVFSTQTGVIRMDSTSSSVQLAKLRPLGSHSGKIEPPEYLKAKLKLKKDLEAGIITEDGHPKTTSTSISPIFSPNDNTQTQTANNIVLDAHDLEDLEGFKPRRKVQKVALIIVTLILVLAGTGFALLYFTSSKNVQDNSTSVETVDLYSKNIKEIMKSAVPGQEQNFLKMADDFFEKYPEPKTTVQRTNLNELLKVFVELDEKLRIPEPRSKARAKHLKEIEVTKELAEKQAAIAKEQAAERLRLQREEQARRKQLEAERRKEQAEIRQHLNQIAVYKRRLPYELSKFVEEGNIAGAESLRNEVISGVESFRSSDRQVLKQAADLKSYASSIISELKIAEEYRKLVYNSGTELRGMQIETRIDGKRSLLKVNKIENGLIQSQDIISGKSADLKIGDMDEELFNSVVSRIERRQKVSGINFYLDLQSKNFSDKMIPPNEFWKEKLADFQRDYFVGKLRDASSSEKAELRRRFGSLKNFPK